MIMARSFPNQLALLSWNSQKKNTKSDESKDMLTEEEK